MSKLIASARKSGDNNCCCFVLLENGVKGDFITVTLKDAFEVNDCESCCGCCGQNSKNIEVELVSSEDDVNKYMIKTDACKGDLVCICRESFK